RISFPVFSVGLFAAGGPRRAGAFAERFRLFSEQTSGQTRRASDMRAAARVDRCGEARAPWRQRLVRLGEVSQHREILTRAELLTQAMDVFRPVRIRGQRRRTD